MRLCVRHPEDASASEGEVIEGLVYRGRDEAARSDSRSDLDGAGMETRPTYSKLGSHLFKSLLLCYND